ncbi:MAG TPA: hypothetical protein PLW80_03370 [Spirochaetales bacterium]|nr:hypothetical protein [Spirochaetales bacterium]
MTILLIRPLRSARALALAARALALIALAGLMVVPAAALDLEASAFFGNLGLPWAGEEPLTGAQFPSDAWIYGGKAGFTDELGEGLSLYAGYETDPTLRHVVKGIISYESGIASISAGPRVGVFNTAQTPLKAGIEVGFRLDAPGIAFFSVDTASSMGVGLASAGDYSQEYSDISAGWYVYNAICSFSMTTKRYTRVLASGEPLVDASNDYLFSVDTYKKGAPYRVLTELGYRTMTRSYPDGSSDGLGAVVLAAEISADVSPALTLVAGLDSGVYVFGIESLAGRGPASSAFMFSASLGAVVRLPQAGAAIEQAAE